MSEENKSSTHDAITNISEGITGQRLNLILAVCAILISAASFYATYLQADSAEKQVKAMTLPLIQFSHGNYDEELGREVINFSLKNAGIGPAIIKTVNFKYNEKIYEGLAEFFQGCCKEGSANYFTLVKEKSLDESDRFLTSPLANTIIGGQTEYNFLSIALSKNSKLMWSNINDARWQLSLEICYCSLLGECYITEKNGIVDPIDFCPIKKPKSKLL